MADNVAVTAGSGTSIAADEVVDATLGTVKVQMVKIMDGTLDGTNKMKILGASTAPTATDPAVVVAISPNGQLSGQQTMSSSAPVVIASDQSSVPMRGDINPGVAESSSYSPVKQGFYATTSQSGLTLVSNAQRANGVSGVDGVQITRPHTNLEDIVSGVATITDGSSTSVISAAGSGVKIYVTSVVIANTSTTAVTVDIRDGTSGSVKATLPVPGNTSGVIWNPPVPLGGFTANTALAADPSAAASSIIVTVVGFKSKI